MGLLKALLEAVKWLVVALLLGAGILVGSGNAEPYLSPSTVPGGPAGVFGGMLVGVVVVTAGLGALQTRIEGDEWAAAGRHAGLQVADSAGRRGYPALTGTVDGVSVTARVETHTANSTEGTTTRVPYTLVEADLPDAPAAGVLVGRDRNQMRAARGDLDVAEMVDTITPDEALSTAELGEISAVGTSDAALQAVTTGPPGEALRSLEQLDLAYIGDAAGVVTRYADARNEALEESVFEMPVEDLVDRVPADAATVTIETKDLVLNVDEFRRHVLAAVAIADALADSAARTSPAE